ncbi:MAG: class I SAM-dependent methyltransferase [bacterium]|nr:class I SAM-dependent methyltransferase [bacterium]MDZ4299598.1 class I SAM-dependent methyltransferase [Candidatus Sungbacteria bacterium]
MKKPAYMTVEEMREHPEWIEAEEEEGGTRFRGTTTPELAFKYFSDKNGRILECGPHRGAFTKLLIKHGYSDIHAVDFYDGLMGVDRQKVDFRMVDMNTEKLSYPDNYFSGVTAWGIGEHMENPYLFMREVHRVLKPGGVVIFALPNVAHIMSRLVFLKRATFPRWSVLNNHIAIFTRDIIQKTFLRSFDLVETVYTRPGIQYLFFHHFDRFLPANEWFGNYVVYIMKKR